MKEIRTTRGNIPCQKRMAYTDMFFGIGVSSEYKQPRKKTVNNTQFIKLQISVSRFKQQKPLYSIWFFFFCVIEVVVVICVCVYTTCTCPLDPLSFMFTHWIKWEEGEYEFSLNVLPKMYSLAKISRRFGAVVNTASE